MHLSKPVIALVAIGGSILIGLIVVVSIVISASNTEVDIRTAIVAKQRDNKNEMDGMWKTIAQTAQVTDAQKNALIEIFNGHAKARTGTGGGGEIMKWVQESVPNVDTSTFNNLQNIITAKRDGFVFRQKELLDLSRAHNRLLGRFPSGAILGMLGRRPIDVVIVTSTRTESAFEAGKDDDVKVFQQ